MEMGFHRTQEFAIEIPAGEEWKELHRGTTIAGSRTFEFSPVMAQVVRLNILKANECRRSRNFVCCRRNCKGDPMKAIQIILACV